MKKLAIFALVLGLVIAFAVPAMAFRIEGPKDTKFYFGGNVMTDFGYWNQSKELTGQYGMTSERTSLFLNMPRHSNIQASVEAGNTGIYWQIRFGADLASRHEQNDTLSATDKDNRAQYVENAKLYGWYKFGNCKIIVGKLDGFLSFLVPGQNLGLDTANHIRGFGWGAYYDGRYMQARFEQDISKQFNWAISLVQPLFTDFTATVGGVTKNYDSYAQYPAVALKFGLNFGPVSLLPSASYQQVKWSDIPSGYDDNVTVWNALLPVRVMAGPFTGIFQIGYGENMGTGGWHSLQNPLAAAFRDPSGKFKTSKSLSGFVDLAFNAGIITPHIYFGYDQVTNSDRWTVGDDNNVRTMYGASATIAISPNFFLTPEVSVYDYGKTPGVAAKTDIGKEWLAGVQFLFTF